VKHIIEAVKQAGSPPKKEDPQVSFLTIDEGAEGQRLDNYLIRVLKGVPKTHIYRLVRSGQVRVNKHRASADTRLALGDLVRIPPVRMADKTGDPVAGAEMANGANLTKPRDFEILFEDEHLLAIAKPAGVAVHGGSGVSFGVIEQLRKTRPDARFLELVHRLDRDTSGVLLLAKRRSALTRLQDQFRDRETGKTYLALVAGHWPANKKVLDQPLHKYLLDNGERRVQVVAKDDPDGMPSLTLIKHITKGGPQLPLTAALESLPAHRWQFSLLEISLKTGRTHQIRVHLAHQGYRIVGDDKYGDFELNKTLEKLGVKRMFLHARTLSFLHPSTQQTIQIDCPLDEELKANLGLLLALKVP
jgi:23S rRNA pseudouridine955/2504/2580 synthase